MELAAFFARVRDHYVDQFGAFIEREEQKCVRGHAEVKFELPEPTGFYQRMICVDFVTNDAGAVLQFFKPDRMLDFHPITGEWGTMGFEIQALRWDSIVIHHDCANIPDEELKAWFDQWFDPRDLRHDSSAKLGLVVHSLSIKPGCLEIDFGSAPADALTEMLELLERSGATSVRVDGATPESN